MTPRRMRRRDFLGSVGAGAALAPFVPFLNRRAEADSGFPQRLLLIFTGNGTLENEFWPTGGESDFTFKPGSITEPLAPYRNHLIFPRGLRRLTSGSGAHEKNMGGLWTCCGLVATNGYPRGPSIDQVIAQGLTAKTAFKSLQFGVQADSFNPGGNKPVLKSMTYSGSNAVVRPEDNPRNMFNKLMLGAGGGPTLSPEDLQRSQARRQSVLDAVRGDLRSLSARLGGDDRAKLDQHLEGIAGLEKRLIQPIGGGPAAGASACSVPDIGTFNDPAALALNENFPMIMDVQNKLAVAALACDRTRVATLQWSRSFSPIRHQWVGVREDHHTISHRTGAPDIRMLHAINRWYGERFAELLGQLAAVKEGEGTLLDNTLVVWGNEASTGNHAATPPVTLLAGRMGGRINTGTTGRMLDLQGYDWSQLLITLAHGMGVSSLTEFGDLGMKGGDIPTLLRG
jgi:hypothetical protein